eukprot:GHVS01081991.1.p1 GENE.GHVS01081991.1~~GHVS01081991.1.p1  ORF type:complete len:135 (-),score=21.18 GHVS01081991.1:364-768(-)
MDKKLPIVWFDVGLSAADLRPQHFLSAGQSFSWKSCGDSEWLGVIANSLIHIKQTSSNTLCRYVAPLPSSFVSAASSSLSSTIQTASSLASHPSDYASCPACLGSSGDCICSGVVGKVRQLFNADVPILPLIQE